MQTDVVHSRAFREKCGSFVGGSGYRNIVLMLYADGVSVATRRDSSMFVISAQVVNLPPDKRRLLSNMLLLQIIPGPKTPSNILGLLQPLVDELLSLYTHGVDIAIDGATGTTEEVLNIKAMFITIVADSRAHPKLTMMKQIPAIYPCHLCLLKVTTQPRHAFSAVCYPMWLHMGTYPCGCIDTNADAWMCPSAVSVLLSPRVPIDEAGHIGHAPVTRVKRSESTKKKGKGGSPPPLRLPLGLWRFSAEKWMNSRASPILRRTHTS